MFLKRDIKALAISLIITILVITPYLYRNHQNFDNLILTKSFGYNLLKGNNPKFKVEGNANFIENNFVKKNLKIKADTNYEIELDDFYKNKALQYITSNPLKYLYLISF